MAHLPGIIYDLALILIVGAFVTILFKRIKQPLVLGYIIAGFLVGPHFGLIPSIVDEHNVEIYAEIGVILLLFSLGLEFSFKKLMRVGGSASITAGVEILFVCAGGYITGHLMGWSQMDSLFLGGMLASSSTTIILRAFEELRIKTKPFARIVFGVLVVEDIIVILLMVLLSTVAVTQQFEGMEILFTVLKLGFFLVLWVLLGTYLLPIFIKKTKKWMDDEILLMLSMGLCFAMVIIATKVGFSAELGAFVMGSLIAETTAAEKVEKLTLSIKQFFGTIFFVSVGMMIDPAAMVEYAGPILIVTLLTIFGKFIFSALGALISGHTLKESIEVGSSMAQIGEFAFIVATLGMSLGVISDFLFPIAVGVSAITTFTTPYLIKSADHIYDFIAKILPKKWIDRIDAYAEGSKKMSADSHWKKYIQAYLKILFVNTILLIAITLLMKFVVMPFISSKIEDSLWSNVITLTTGSLMSLPFIWAIIAKQPSGEQNTEEESKIIRYNPNALMAMNIGRVMIAILVMGFCIDQIVSTKAAVFAAPVIILILLKIFNTRFGKIYQQIENQFMANLSERERQNYRRNKVSIDLLSKNEEIRNDLESWNAYIVELEAGPNIPFAGMTLQELQWKEKYGINVVYIKRGDYVNHLPDRYSRIVPYDKVGILGTEEQISKMRKVFDRVKNKSTDESMEISDIKLRQIELDEHSPYIHKNIRESGIREDLHCSVVGIERDGFRIMNPISTEILHSGDKLWIIGDIRYMKNYEHHS